MGWSEAKAQRRRERRAAARPQCPRPAGRAPTDCTWNKESGGWWRPDASEWEAVRNEKRKLECSARMQAAAAAKKEKQEKAEKDEREYQLERHRRELRAKSELNARAETLHTDGRTMYCKHLQRLGETSERIWKGGTGCTRSQSDRPVFYLNSGELKERCESCWERHAFEVLRRGEVAPADYIPRYIFYEVRPALNPDYSPPRLFASQTARLGLASDSSRVHPPRAGRVVHKSGPRAPAPRQRRCTQALRGRPNARHRVLAGAQPAQALERLAGKAGDSKL